MARIEGIRIQNFRVLKDVTIGKLWSLQQAVPLNPMTAVSGSQVFITTHQPYFVDALSPEEVWVLEKGEDGFAVIRRASADPLVQNMVAEGLPLGSLWYSDYLDAR